MVCIKDEMAVVKSQKGEYDIIDLALQIYEQELQEGRKKYMEKRKLADNYGLEMLEHIYSEVANVYKHELKHFNDRHI